MLVALPIVILAGYLLGALPFGYLVARARGVNIFEVGSRNPGATNVLRQLGRGPGYTVFVLDAAKGALATALPWLLIALGLIHHDALVTCSLVGIFAALLGHSFSCFTGFRGGKGVATATGGLLVLVPLSIAIGAVIWYATFVLSRYVSLASLLAAISMPFSSYFLGKPAILVVVVSIIAVIVIVRHRANIARLLRGTEHRFVRKAPGTR